MKTFELHLRDPNQYSCIQQVASFIGQDRSGSFGILADHARMMTVLDFGLARYKTIDQDWRYIATPGATVYFYDNRLSINSQRILLCDDYHEIEQALQQTLKEEEQAIGALKASVRNIEERILRQMSQLNTGRSLS